MPCYYTTYGSGGYYVNWPALIAKYTAKGLPHHIAERCAYKYARNKGWYR